MTRKTKKKSGGSKAPSRKKKKQNRSWLAFAVKWALVLGMWASIGLGIILAWYAAELPAITKAANFERRTALTIKANDGTILTRYGDLKGNSVSVNDLPPHLINAVLATEDRRFYKHFGVDPIGLARAMATNITHGRLVQGGSTITQQLAKNLFLSHERTLKRKIQEAMLALWLEHELTKDEILTAYLNRVYLGAGTYGVDAASQLYFKKPATQVNLREAAILAGLLKAPSRYSPFASEQRANDRAKVVLRAMAGAGYITEDHAKGLANLPPVPAAKPSEVAAVRYFTDWVVDGLDELIGTPEEDLIIETTLNPDIQNAAEKTLTQKLLANSEDRKISQGATLVMSTDGAILAMIGGKNYRESQFNRAVQAKRQPGSSFKPFVFLSALENGWDPNDIIYDGPIEEGSYRPTNFGGKYYGDVSLTTALMLSMNTATVRLMDDVGRGNVINTAHRIGIISPVDRNLSSALGSSSVSLLEMTTAYAAIANEGLRALPYAITKISNKDGTVYYERPRTVSASRVIERRPARELKKMMRYVIEEGTGRAARLPFPASGKTGTSQDFRDAWFMGYTDDVVAGVWLGNDDNSPTNGVTGGSLPAQIWKDIMLAAYNERPSENKFLEQQGHFNSLLGRLLSGPSAEEERAQQAQETIYWNSQRHYND